MLRNEFLIKKNQGHERGQSMETLIDHQNLKLEKEGKLAWVTFTRERYLNAVDNGTSRQFHHLLLALAEDPRVRVVIIQGRGRAFSTGLDLKEFYN